MEERTGNLKPVLRREIPLVEILRQITMIMMERRAKRDGG